MAFHWQQTPGDVKDTSRKILAELAEGARTRLALQRQIFASTFVGSYTVIDALRWCSEHRYIERTPSRRYRLTDAGRNALDLADMLDRVGGVA